MPDDGAAKGELTVALTIKWFEVEYTVDGNMAHASADFDITDDKGVVLQNGVATAQVNAGHDDLQVHLKTQLEADANAALGNQEQVEAVKIKCAGLYASLGTGG